MIPGQLGPMRRISLLRTKSYTRSMSRVGTPSVIQTMRPIPALPASRIASAANNAGTNITEAFAWVFRTASATVLNTGTSRLNLSFSFPA